MSKGSNAERELVHLFWQKGWTACRVAGSGSMHYPSPDILASKEGTHLAIECKTTKSEYQYLSHKEVEELIRFAKIAKKTPLIGIKFSKTPWHIISPNQLKKTAKHYMTTKKEILRTGTHIDTLIKTKTLKNTHPVTDEDETDRKNHRKTNF